MSLIEAVASLPALRVGILTMWRFGSETVGCSHDGRCETGRQRASRGRTETTQLPHCQARCERLTTMKLARLPDHGQLEAEMQCHRTGIPGWLEGERAVDPTPTQA